MSQIRTGTVEITEAEIVAINEIVHKYQRISSTSRHGSEARRSFDLDRAMTALSPKATP